MKISEKIIEKILSDNQFSLKLALLLDIQQVSVRALAKSNSDKLAHFKLVEFYKKEGFSEDEIWENK